MDDESLIAGVRQKPGESLPEFIDQVQQNVQRMLLPGTSENNLSNCWNGKE